MYTVMVVDDEPAALNHIQLILKKKCEGFQVMDTAYHGREALEKIKREQPDVVLTDVSMPVMSGIELVKELKKEYPLIISVIVSGYQEFEYAKEALRSGVADYILKPIIPSEIQALFERIKGKLEKQYYEQRNGLIKRMVNGTVGPLPLKKFFTSSRYYGAVVRSNGLPSRFAQRNGIETFSDIHELILSYGRDEKETLYLCPAELLADNREEAMEMLVSRIAREQPESDYQTIVIGKAPVPVENIGTAIRKLYRKLDSSLVIGKSNTIFLEDQEKPGTSADAGSEYLKELEYYIENERYEKCQKKIKLFIKKWKEEEKTQIWVEAQIRQICYLLQRYGKLEMDYRESEFLLDEIFANVESMDQLGREIQELYFQNMEDEKCECKLNSEEYFKRIKRYIEKHMAEPLRLSKVSREMGVSQAYLSKLFRKYEDTSFNSYLTAIRMERAKTLFEERGDVFVKDVAELVGYKDQFYFSRIFYSYTGIRPSEYIERITGIS